MNLRVRSVWSPAHIRKPRQEQVRRGIRTDSSALCRHPPPPPPSRMRVTVARVTVTAEIVTRKGLEDNVSGDPPNEYPSPSYSLGDREHGPTDDDRHMTFTVCKRLFSFFLIFFF